MAVCTKTFFPFFLICFFCILESRKPGISIPDFVFYDIKILLDINQNDIRTTRKNYKMLKIFFNFFLNGPGRPKYMCEHIFLLSLSSVFVLFSTDSLSSSFFRFFFLFLSSLYPLSCNPSPSLPLFSFFFSSLPLFL